MLTQDWIEVFKKYPDFDVVFTSLGEESIYVGEENVTVNRRSEEIFIDVGLEVLSAYENPTKSNEKLVKELKDAKD